jgi:hypothetical protein
MVVRRWLTATTITEQRAVSLVRTLLTSQMYIIRV